MGPGKKGPLSKELKPDEKLIIADGVGVGAARADEGVALEVLYNEKGSRKEQRKTSAKAVSLNKLGKK